MLTLGSYFIDVLLHCHTSELLHFFFCVLSLFLLASVLSSVLSVRIIDSSSAGSMVSAVTILTLLLLPWHAREHRKGWPRQPSGSSEKWPLAILYVRKERMRRNGYEIQKTVY